ncbi:ABC transporter ATP-binding protein [Aestuariivirga litoralis]|uniref:ABC transporter ATP-binding protein n=1 Tax=Aestuariivirga litoralis TaxID=2650924 RepID=UPI0018C72016|nr:ABC transporter ATP-binding protein [Aestuariivirga litoralis]MBG1233247.1 ABC transporter ATP-binding protein [Aestuariivirga litoralis]
MASIELKNLRKSFQTAEVIHGVDLKIDDGAFTVFVGPSGCGKSTLLRMMAGLEPVTNGEIHIDGARCDHLMPAARGMAMVFQSYALYPHMNVEQNLRFGLENQKLPKAEISARVKAAADILQIQHLLQRRPHQLSGGQSQRVAIGRAIVKEPKAFLFDEPLSNLDAELRLKMRGELVALHHRLKATMVYVTHDQVEAMTMADKIVVLRDGIIEQTGSPIELYTKPANMFVAGFLGTPQMNFLDLSKDAFKLPKSVAVPQGKAVATIGIRPEHVSLGGKSGLVAKVIQCEVLGSETIAKAELTTGEAVAFSLRGINPLALGSKIALDFDLDHLHLFDDKGLALRK